MARAQTSHKHLLTTKRGILLFILFSSSLFLMQTFVQTGGKDVDVSLTLGQYIPLTTEVYNTVRAQQIVRINHTRQICNYTQSKTLSKQEIQTIKEYTNVIVDDKHKIMYCYIPKVSCTSWKVKLVNATGLAHGVLLNTHPSVVDSRNGLRKYGLYFLNEYSPDQIKHRIANYYKFIFVRHPMERILSAYRSKWEKRADNLVEREWSYAAFFNEIINSVRKNKSDKTSMVTFEEFVNYLIWRSRQPGLMETHWERYHKLCHMCSIDYNFIGKFDTLVNDIAFVLRKIFPNSQDHFFPNVSMPRSAASLLKKYYSQLDRKLIDQLEMVYQRDIKLFGYDFHSV